MASMKKRILLLVLASVLLSGCSLTGIFRKKFAAIQISTSPKSEVYLNDEKAGETPFKSEKLKSEEYSIRLVSTEEGMNDFQTSITLQPNTTAIISYSFAKDRDQSSGYVLTLEPISDENKAEIAVVTIPDNSSVKLDGQPKGFTPLQIKSTPAGDHKLSLSAPGYKQQQIEIKTIEGHKLTIDAQLAKETLFAEDQLDDNQEEDSSQESAEEEEKKASLTTTTTKTKTATASAQLEKPYLEVLDTPTGWLRVRSEPSTAQDNEIAKINPGESYKYIESNDTGWHRIELTNGEKGWVSGRYTKLFK